MAQPATAAAQLKHSGSRGILLMDNGQEHMMHVDRRSSLREPPSLSLAACRCTALPLFLNLLPNLLNIPRV